MTNLWLSNNRIASTIPTKFGMMTQLQELDLESNLLNGPIPDELYSLTNLQTLYLHDNMLAGSISPLISQMTSLTILDLDTNYISGELPSEIGLMSFLNCSKCLCSKVYICPCVVSTSYPTLLCMISTTAARCGFAKEAHKCSV